MDRIYFSTRPANDSRVAARSLSAKKIIGFCGDRRDCALELSTIVTSGDRRSTLFFSNQDAEELLTRFITLGGDRPLVQFLPTTGDVENLIGWLRLWRPTPMILDRDDHNVYLFSSVKFIGTLRPSVRGGPTTRRANAQHRLQSPAARTGGQR